MVEFIKKLLEPESAYYTVCVTDFLKKKSLLRLGEYRAQTGSQVSQFCCPNCDTNLDSIALREHTKCFLCGLEMQRIDLNRIRCKK